MLFDIIETNYDTQNNISNHQIYFCFKFTLPDPKRLIFAEVFILQPGIEQHL